MTFTSTDQAFLVFNCEVCGIEGVSAMDKHERLRICAASNIDPTRTHLNRTLHGNPDGPATASTPVVSCLPPGRPSGPSCAS